MIRRRVTFKIAAATGAALLAGALAACSGGGGGGGGGGNSASSSTPIVVCSDEALSGVYAQIGESDNWGSTAYFKHVNATGGILGHKVNYISLNNQSNAAQSELDAQEVHPDLPRAVHRRPGVRGRHRVRAADRDRQQDDPDQPVLRLADQRLPGERADLVRLPRLLRRVRRGPDRLGAEPDRAQAVHPGRAARGQLRLGLPGQPGHRAGPGRQGRLPARLHPDRPGRRHRRHPAGARHAGRQAADHPLRPGARHRLDHRHQGHPGAGPDHPDQRVLRAARSPASSRRPAGRRRCRTSTCSGPCGTG